jgi:hypothetical protein
MRLTTVSVVSLVLFASAGSIRADTRFLIAKTGDRIDGRELVFIGHEVDINNCDEVVFWGSFDDGDGWFTDAIFTQHRLVVTEADTIDGTAVGTLLSAPSINNAGEIVYSAMSGIFVDRRRVYSRSGSCPQINDGGTLAFIGNSVEDAGLVVGDQVVLGSGDAIDGRTFDGFGNYPHFRINASGEVAFFWFGGDAIVTSPDNHVIAGAGTVIDGRTLVHVMGRNHFTPINNSGSVAFWARLDGGAGIFTQDRLLVAEGDTIDGKTLTLLHSADSINNAGEVTFVAEFDGGTGVFTQNRLVAQTGDAIDGRTLTEIKGFPQINDLGHVAFSAKFADGTSGIVLAVPEPSAAVLLPAGASVLTFLAVARRRRLPA